MHLAPTVAETCRKVNLNSAQELARSMTSEWRTLSIWVDCSSWEARWTEIRSLGKGGQGKAYFARRTTDNVEAFLKVINDGDDHRSERRKRFLQEATAYAKIRSSGVPRLIESNAHQHGKEGLEPYVATEFICGLTLRHWVDKEKPIDFRDAIEITRSILKTLCECHAKEVVHRDIKPENIILKDEGILHPVLVDFGMSFHLTPTSDSITRDGNEIGNRFLRLPEFSAGHSSKRDPRSDLTLTAGIFFYLLTSKNPRLLLIKNKLPHQRGDVRKGLEDSAGRSSLQLFSFFDRAFAHDIDRRFASADEMLSGLDKVMDAYTTCSGDSEENENSIKAILSSPMMIQREERKNRYIGAWKQIRRVFEDIMNPVDPGHGGAKSFSDDVWSVRLEWMSGDNKVQKECEVREEGSELVIWLDGEPVYRTISQAPDYGVEFQKTIERWFDPHLQSALADTYHKASMK